MNYTRTREAQKKIPKTILKRYKEGKNYKKKLKLSLRFNYLTKREWKPDKKMQPNNKKIKTITR